MNSFSQFLGVVASILGILAFFGFARFSDIQKAFDAKQAVSHKTNLVTTESTVDSKAMWTRGFAGAIGGAIAGFTYNLFFTAMFIPFVPIIFSSLMSAFSTGLIWGIGAGLGTTVLDPTDAVKKGTVGGAIAGVVLFFIFSPFFNASLLITMVLGSVILGITGCLIGAAASSVEGRKIGSLGGAINGIIAGIPYAPAGLVAGLFIGIVTGGLGGHITGRITESS